MSRKIRFPGLLLAAALLSSCSSSPVSRFYTLEPDAGLAHSGATAPISIAVGPVSIPELVDRPQIVTRLGNNEVRVNEFARWAEPLGSDIARTLATDLSELLGTGRVTVFDSGANLATTWRVRLDVMRFDSEPAVAVSVDAQWTVQPPGKAAPVTGYSAVREPVAGQGYDALVAAHGQALAAMSQAIASAIRDQLAQFDTGE